MKILVVPTGIANIASIRAGLQRVGADIDMAHSPDAVRDAAAVVLPGVGAFGAGMAALHDAGMVGPLKARIAAGRPLLCVCLGMQLLAHTSAETPGVEGLGVLPTHVARFPSDVKVPQLGWNRILAHRESRFLVDGYAYFANSYRLNEVPVDYHASTADYAGPFVAACERDLLLACQFHPELSGPWGLGLLGRWVAAAAEAARRAA